MEESSSLVAPYLIYGILFTIVVNFFISFFLTYFSNIRGLKLVFYYWSSLLVVYLFQGLLTANYLQIIIGYGFSIFPCVINSKILLDSINKPTPYVKYAIIFVTGLTISIFLSFFNFSFTTQALPLTILITIPMLWPTYLVLFTKKDTSTPLQKFMCFLYVLSAVHSINFALFRMQEGSQVLGFGFALILYQTMSLSLLAFSIEENSKKEKERLQEQVDERTKDLSSANNNLQNALTVKEMLLKVVLHDIANPVSAQSMYLETLNDSNYKLILPKFSSLNKLIISIITKVRALAPLGDGNIRLKLEAVSLKTCFESAKLVFNESLAKKNIELKLETSLPEDACFSADETTFTTSVLNNLISNAIKFSHPNTYIIVRSFEKDGRIIIEIEDQGIGMSDTIKSDLFNPLTATSTTGTHGEIGTGYGLALVKYYVDNYQGHIQVVSRPIEAFPDQHGTKFVISLEKA